MGPMTYQGRVITAEVIEQMRAEQPEHAHQLDDAWARMVLENNRPWTEDAELRVGTEAVRAGIRQAAPAAFASCGTGGDDQPHLHAPDAPGVRQGPA
ncbi:hypothetical protein ACFRFL_34525 [Streptomyces sp. NPDC056708]|uniref:hypothetical protein n=2 Tax=Streptomyces TaxID=1883 RepID=UPI00368F2AE1